MRRRATHGKQGLDVFLLGVLLRLALLRFPSGPFATFGELHHTGLGGVDVSFVGLLEEAVELRGWREERRVGGGGGGRVRW